MEWLSWFSDMTPWFALIAGLFAIVAITGLGKVMDILSKLLDIVGPALKSALEGVVNGTKWVASTILWPGLKDILDSWATITTVIFMCTTVWFWMDHKVDKVVDQLSACQNENTRLERSMKSLGKPQAEQSWFDGLFRW